MDELEGILKRQLGEFASGVLGHPQGATLDRSAEAGMSMRLRGHERMSHAERCRVFFLRLADPMLTRPGPLPFGSGWSFELKWDGFRAIVSTEDGLYVRSRRGWNMTTVLPELRDLPAGLVLDGELVAWKGSEPYFPHICRRVLTRDTSVPMTFVIFDLLGCNGRDLTRQTYEERRHELVKLGLDGPTWITCEAFEDGRALYAAVCELGYEGVVAKDRASLYGFGERGWVKIKNPGYWRRDAEIEGVQRSRERRGRAAWSKTV